MAMAGLLKVLTKNRRLVPLILNETQVRIINAIYAQQEAGRPIRILELKGRQQGSSTGIGAYCYIRAICEPNTNALIITEEKQGSAQNIFSMYQRYDHFFPVPLDKEASREGQLLRYAPPIGSRIKVEGEKAVTSYTYQIVHLSEAAFFQRLSSVLAMLFQTVPDDPTTAIFLETTANAYGDDFHTEWVRAAEGRNDFYPLFIPWFAHEEYKTPIRESEQFQRDLRESSDSEYGNEWALLDAHPELSLEALAWRRSAIRNRCQGSLVEFNRQYPSTAEEAFITSGTNVFDLAALKLADADVQDPIARGFFEINGETVNFRDDPQGIVWIYEPPEPGREYACGSDHAEGLDAGDFNSGVMLCRLPFRYVARIRGFDGRRVDIDEFAEQLYGFCRYYNDAWVCPENNKDGGTVCNTLINTYRYGRVLPETLVTGNRSKRHGWYNSSVTRRRGISMLQPIIRHRELWLPDPKLLAELRSFIFFNGRPQAAKKGVPRKPGESEIGFYDDLIFATIGALYVHEARPIPSAPGRWAPQVSTAQVFRPQQPQNRGLWNYN